MYKISVDKLTELFRLIKEKRELFLPVKTAGQVNFSVWEEESLFDLTTLKTVKSPKDIFFPQSETLYSVKKENRKMTVTPAKRMNEEFVVFGMKACDLRGIEVLDKVFLSEPEDSFYAARRAHGTIVSLSCNEPSESCFCKVFGIDCAEPGADVSSWINEGMLYLKPNTEKGSELIGQCMPLLSDAKEEELKEHKENIRKITDMLPNSNLSLDGWGGAAIDEKFESPLWEKLYKPCLACGTCTFVCPTCQCYDIKDYNTGSEVHRYRCWDSCMYSDFTMMAHGNNRTTQLQRFRQRFMHKLCYFPENNDGMYSCTGCGRCVDKCPSSLNIVKVIKAFDENGGV